VVLALDDDPAMIAERVCDLGRVERSGRYLRLSGGAISGNIGNHLHSAIQMKRQRNEPQPIAGFFERGPIGELLGTHFQCQVP
jgi:hypothetical protein